ERDLDLLALVFVRVVLHAGSVYPPKDAVFDGDPRDAAVHRTALRKPVFGEIDAGGAREKRAHHTAVDDAEDVSAGMCRGDPADRLDDPRAHCSVRLAVLPPVAA